MDPAKELYLLSDSIGDAMANFEAVSSRSDLVKVMEVCSAVQDAWSGSNLGYHANVYYDGLRPPPAGAHFSPEWGFEITYFGAETDPGFKEYQSAYVMREISRRANGVSIENFEAPARELTRQFEAYQRDAISILSIAGHKRKDSFFSDITKDVKALGVTSPHKARQMLYPSGQKVSRDMLAITQGTRLAPHQEVWADALSISSTLGSASALMELSRQAGAHLSRIAKIELGVDRVDVNPGKTIFVGHGRSPIWRELKDFLRDTLNLDVEEFGRIPTAGISTASRLANMLDAASFAFLVMTPEDDTIDGKKTARQNVIHEVGLFQGRLGSERAIVILEEGCEEFSNIVGIGQLRFPPGRISAVFEDVRNVLRREGILR